MSQPPKTLGAYVVEQEIGRGGMGIVYLARDPRLDRPVAIKVLPDAFLADAERLVRFEREARLLASLNHPSIGAIFGIEEDAGRRFLVLQYVPGETLAQRLGHGPLGLDDALDVCRQIAAALEAAHESGVIHRDMKPGNVKITPAGEVKVLDFGLAKGAETAGSSSDLSHSPTLAFSVTGAGVILGTAAYMSPEQARGKPVDRRTDIWSFGCVLYECLSGRRPFAGETVSDTIAQILERQPDFGTLPPQTPPRVRDLLERCLDKDARKRLRDIGDARLEVEAAIAARSTTARTATAPAPATRATIAPRALALAAGLLTLGAALGISAWNVARPGGGTSPSGSGPIRLSVSAPADFRMTSADLSPDGRALVVRGIPRSEAGRLSTMLHVRPLDRFEFRPLPGTEGVSAYTFSPDGKWVLFRALVSKESAIERLAKVAIDGNSPAVTITEWDNAWSAGFTWMPDGDILLTSARGRSLLSVPASGGPPSAERKLDSGDAIGRLLPGAALPGGRALFATMESWGARGFQNDVWLLDPTSGKARLLIANAGSPAYVPTGHVMFSRSDALFAAPFDLGRLDITGEAAPLMSGLRTGISWGHGGFVVAGGTLLSVPGGVTGARRRLMMVGAGGDSAPFSTERRGFEQPPAVSRDGRRVAVVVPDTRGTFEIWIADRDRPGLTPGAALPNADCLSPVLSPDGQQLALERNARSAEDGIYIQRLGSGEPPVRVLAPSTPVHAWAPLGWSPDGAALTVVRAERGRRDLYLFRLGVDSARALQALRTTPADEYGATFSPDGHRISFISDESGKYQVYVAAFGTDGALGTPWMVPTGPYQVVNPPRWARDGSLLYVTDDNRLMRVALGTAGPQDVAAPAEILNLREELASPAEWCPLPDGRLLVIRRGEEEDELPRLDLVLHWTDELRQVMAKARSGGR